MTIVRSLQTRYTCYALLLILFTFSGSGCGRRRPPVPPAAVINPVGNLSAVQRGDQIILTLKSTATALNKQQSLSIYRLSESSDADSISLEDFSARASVIATIAVNNQSETIEANDKLSNLTNIKRLRYAIRFNSEDNRRSGFSNFAVVTVAIRIPQPPILQTAVTEPNAVKLQWERPAFNLDNSIAAPIGYQIYRVLETDSNAARQIEKLTAAPVTGTIFRDQSFVFGSRYRYFVRAVVIDADGLPLESADSNSLSLVALDTFAPAAPSNLTVAAAPNRLSLFFAANAEPDIAGYFVYRNTDEQKPLDQWQKLNQTPLTATTFQDLTVESGVKYFYYVTAVDRNGNVSPASEIAAETAP